VTTVQELIAELPEGAGAIPLPTVRRIINDHLGTWDRGAPSRAVMQGAITALPERTGHGGAYMVDRDEAVLILVAAVLAFAAGVAVVAMIRAVKISGVDPGVFIKSARSDMAVAAVLSRPSPAKQKTTRDRQQAHQRAGERARNRAAQKAAQTT